MSEVNYLRMGHPLRDRRDDGTVSFSPGFSPGRAPPTLIHPGLQPGDTLSREHQKTISMVSAREGTLLSFEFKVEVISIFQWLSRIHLTALR